ncbi:TPA: hypothetical protein DEP34_04790 [Candidatus Uhrbacteria bacterium]|uniref:Excinuclease ABC subunit C n=2 Tax=Candidatus Uhriibacteriota TaxID=1752732 RepID=A0A0G1Q717_9BACT|nr:MAG: Excinuclease ABC subunit C [Candidatus Uhrbacteria bacterium GW2011_GWF2_46_218]KKU40851.1 MAG: Excinuclease ABC subunit C [Candidatus Uhrbacteria bacterium GW2011_GWE2_46_68]HBK33915.1 hypothetical protein [Candidatus Uhrbacteria bacterium]HCB19660.1 hypothetical protein [Candidatus Uhrbacteria bacterium]
MLMIPPSIIIKQKKLPDEPGVYFYYDVQGKLLYIGKATSLKRRVSSYFTKAHDRRIGEMVRQIARIDYQVMPTVIEALVLEANQIKAHRPKYNILEQDDRSFLYLVITREVYPRPVLMRGHELHVLGINPFCKELSKEAKKKFLAVYGPYISGRSLRQALEIVRPMIPWSDCESPRNGEKARPCFPASIGLCPGVCTGAITPKEYRKIIQQLLWFFEGKKGRILRTVRTAMKQAAHTQDFEQAVKYRNQISALEHIQDIALIQREDREVVPQTEVGGIDLHGRIEAYDMSSISGTSAVGSMVVFENGKPAKDQYRKFKIKTVRGVNDVGMLEEVLRRRLAHAHLHPHAWPLPILIVIDGGEGHMLRAQNVLSEMGFFVPLIGIAKGFDRKQDRLVYDRTNPRLLAVAERGKEIFQRARDEAHRFAIQYHRKVRGRLKK